MKDKNFPVASYVLENGKKYIYITTTNTEEDSGKLGRDETVSTRVRKLDAYEAEEIIRRGRTADRRLALYGVAATLLAAAITTSIIARITNPALNQGQDNSQAIGSAGATFFTGGLTLTLAVASAREARQNTKDLRAVQKLRRQSHS